MKTVIIPTFFALLLAGCANDRGISSRYYNECREYYDAQGYYHKKCDENIVDYQDIADVFKKEEEPPKSNVW